MAQDRMIRASMRSSEKVSGWPFDVRYFWTQLWGYCDDYGRGRYDLRLLKAGIFPLDDDVTPERVGAWMAALETAGVISSYEVLGKQYFECINWHEHQELPYFKRSETPDRNGEFSPAGKRSEVLPKILENSLRREGNRREIEREGASASPFCEAHPQGINKPCTACGRARLAFEAATKTEKLKPTPGPVRKQDLCPQHPDLGYPRSTCPMEHP